MRDFYQSSAWIFSSDRCGDLCFCEVLYLDHLWADSVFFSESDSDWAFHRAGDSRTPLLANFIGLAGNMLLDPLLILGVGPFPRLEIAGAAIATVTSPDAGFCGNDHKDQALPAGA